LQAVTACIEICEALLAGSKSPTGADASASSSFRSDFITETRHSRTERYHVLIHLAHALRERYSHTGHGADLDKAISKGQAALENCGTESILCPTVLIEHASTLEKNFQHTSDCDQLHMAESMCRQALALCTNACTLSATAYHALGWVMFRLYRVVGTSGYLDEALNLQRRGLELSSASHDAEYFQYLRGLAVYTSASHDAEYFQYLRGLAVYTFWRYVKLGDAQDIDDAISFLEQALYLCPAMHINRMLIIVSMMQVVDRKYALYGRLEDLNRGIDLGRQVLAAPNFPGGDRRSTLLNILSNLLYARYEATLSADCDLEESVSLMREALQHTSSSSMFRSAFADNLAGSLRLLFTRKGELQDLDESIELSRHAINLLPEDHVDRSWIFSNLGKSLCHRFHETRNVVDLDEAHVSYQYAMAATSPLQTYHLDIILANISHLCIRFETFQVVDDLDQAVSLSEGLLKTLPDGHIDRDRTVLHLAKALLLRGAHMNAHKDIDRAIHKAVLFRKIFSQSIAAPEVSQTLASSYLVRFRLNKDARDAVHALDITKELLDVVGPGHHGRFQCLVHAAELYLERGTQFYNSASALRYIAEAMSNKCRDVRSKIQGAKGFLDIVRTQYKEVWKTASPAISTQLLDIYISTISFLPRVAFFGLHLLSRLQSLAIGQSIALDGASHALNILLPEKALEILEQGRVTFWNHTLRLRSPFDHAPDEFRDRLAYLARRLEKSSDVLHGTQDYRTLEKEAAQRRQQSEEFNSLADQVRCLPGMERFLLHDEYATLAKAADGGLIVVLVSSALTCHAVAVKSADEIISIPLKSITEVWLDDSSKVWRTEVLKARSTVRDSRKMTKSGKSFESVSTKAKDILAHLWSFAVYPVLSKLGLEVCRFPNKVILVTKLNHDSDSHLLASIDPESGGVQRAVLLTFQFMQQVPATNGVQIMSFPHTPPHSELLLGPGLHSCQLRSIGSKPLSPPYQRRACKVGLICSQPLKKQRP
jgi:tetratricopeptide (TPR) repeat protein